MFMAGVENEAIALPAKDGKSVKKMDLRRVKSQFLHYVHDEANSDTLWMVFSHVDIPKGKFGQRHIMKHLDGCKLFINCADNSWYQQGISATINSLEKLLEALVATAEMVPHCKVLGHSMGAYMSLIMQHLAPVEFAFVISPEPVLMVPHSRSALNGVRPQRGWLDLVRRFRHSTRPAPGFTFYGAYDPIDAYYLAKFEQQQDIYRSVFVVPHHHGVTEYFTHHRCYIDMLKDPVPQLNKLLKDNMVRYASDFGSKHAFLDFYQFYGLMRDRANRETLEEWLKKRASWNNNGWQILRANALRRIGKIEEAAETARLAISRDSYFAEPVVTYAACLSSIGDTASAQQLLDELETFAIAESAKDRVRQSLMRCV
jgi:hypothetical protein